MQNLFSFSFCLTPQCLGPDQYKEEGRMSSAEITTTTNQVYVYKGTGLNLHRAWLGHREQLNTCTARSELNTHTHTHAHLLEWTNLSHFTTDGFLPQGSKITSWWTDEVQTQQFPTTNQISRRREPGSEVNAPLPASQKLRAHHTVCVCMCPCVCVCRSLHTRVCHTHHQALAKPDHSGKVQKQALTPLERVLFLIIFIFTS